MSFQFPNYSGTYTNFDTNATGNSVVVRDGSGNSNHATVTATGLALTSGVKSYPRALKTSAFTLDATAILFACDATTAAFPATLPPAASVSGRVYTIKKIDSTSHAVTITGNAAETIDGSNTVALSAQWNSRTIMSNGTSWEVIATS